VPAATGIVAAGFYACCLKFITMMSWQKQASSLSSDGSACSTYSTGWVHITWLFSEKKTHIFCMRDWEGKSKRKFYSVMLQSLQDVSVWTVTILWPSSRTTWAISASYTDKQWLLLCPSFWILLHPLTVMSPTVRLFHQYAGSNLLCNTV
jgi:hypothetical protein